MPPDGNSRNGPRGFFPIRLVGEPGRRPVAIRPEIGYHFRILGQWGGEIRKFGFGGRGAVPDPRRGLNLLQFRDLPQEERQSCGGEANGGFRRPGEK